MNLPVLLEDPHLVAVAKPPGSIVVPGRGAPERTVREEAEAILGPLWVVHRLDRGTSGVLLLARNADRFFAKLPYSTIETTAIETAARDPR